MARKLVMLTYNIKPGTNLKDYADYTRSVDYGKFRQNPGIQDYAGYVVRENVRGREWFKHFDLMFVDKIEEFHADGKLHFGDPIIHEHAANWRREWGQDDETGWRTDVNITYADEIWG